MKGGEHVENAALVPSFPSARLKAPWRGPRGVVLLLVVLALSVRVIGLVRSGPPLAASLSAARRFWTSNSTTRLLNSALFREQRDFGLRLLEIDRDWPRDRDVQLVVPEAIPRPRMEEQRRRAAYLLAPRRVVLTIRPGEDGSPLSLPEIRPVVPSPVVPSPVVSKSPAVP